MHYQGAIVTLDFYFTAGGCHQVTVKGNRLDFKVIRIPTGRLIYEVAFRRLTSDDRLDLHKVRCGDVDSTGDGHANTDQPRVGNQCRSIFTRIQVLQSYLPGSATQAE